MSSHFAKLKEDLAAKQLELQEEQAAVESIEKLTRELEAQKKALMEKLTALDDRQEEVRTMQKRLDALAAVEPAMSAAMHTKSTTEDVVKHAVENAIRSDHMTAGEIVRLILNTASHINGYPRCHNLQYIFRDLIVDGESVDAAIVGAIRSSNIYDVLQHTLGTAFVNGESSMNLESFFKKEMEDYVLREQHES
ncbi:hypothetical protein LA080_014696 [Diaporthe eres]|uniref:Uncharacterized protein n=1 Tax=Diaporthe vaccinii TaxID=105482 RepID=A0ABR4E0X7_9PEZI|nr:hypothetical protein LA080_014696 [Diaporthe eres]